MGKFLDCFFFITFQTWFLSLDIKDETYYNFIDWFYRNFLLAMIKYLYFKQIIDNIISLYYNKNCHNPMKTVIHEEETMHVLEQVILTTFQSLSCELYSWFLLNILFCSNTDLKKLGSSEVWVFFFFSYLRIMGYFIRFGQVRVKECTAGGKSPPLGLEICLKV